MQQQAGPSGAQCPACGVAVLPGYPNCPRCRASLAQPRAPSAPPAVGGTSVVGSRSRSLWVAGGAAALIAIVVVVRLATGAEPGETAAAIDAPAALEADDIEADELAILDEDDAPELVDDDEPAADRGRIAALEALEDALAARRVWSNVRAADGEDAVVSIQSAACDDRGMGEAIGELRAVLVDAGFRSVRCLARHGSLVFEADL